MGKPLDARTWFERADQFYLACGVLLGGNRIRFMDVLGFPHIVMKAFATEAYLKSLIALQGGVHEDTHNLLTLFDKLDLPSKKALNKRWVNECEPALKRLKKRKITVVDFDTSLRGVLNQSADAFIDFRYVAPEGQARFSVMRFPMFVRALLLEQRPEWLPPSPGPLDLLNSETGVVKTEENQFQIVPPAPAILNPKFGAWNFPTNRIAKNEE